MDSNTFSTTLWAAASLLSLAVLAGTGFTPQLYPPELFVMEGETVIFSCIPLLTVASPLLEIDGVLVLPSRPNSRPYHRDFGTRWMGNRTYYLEDVRLEEDGTEFQCFIAGEGTNILTITVIILPMVTVSTDGVIVLEGESTEIRFDVSGRPFPTSLTWLYNGDLFTGNENVVMVNTSLVIRDASRRNSGNYTLVVSNGFGEDSVWTYLEVVYNEFLVTPINVSIVDGETVTMKCVHRFGWSYIWQANSTILQNETNKMKISEEGTELEYGPVDYRDHNLQLYCIVHSKSNHVFVSSPGTLSVSAPPHVQDYSTTIVTEGQYINIDFIVNSYPPPISFTYYYNNDNLDLYSNGPIRLPEGNPFSLLITNVTRGLAGNYTLVVRNSLGEGSGSIVLTVYYGPEIVPSMEPSVAQINKSISIPCGASVTGNPPPLVTWGYHNGQSIPSDSRFTVLASGHLLLLLASYGDAGLYDCTASNVAGESSVTINLLVLDPPSQPQHFILIAIGPTWIHIQWAPPLTNGSLPVSGYRVTATPQLPHTSDSGNTTSEDDGDRNASSIISLRNSLSSCLSGKSNETTRKNGTTVKWPVTTACVEVVCGDIELSSFNPGETVANLTGLIPNLDYIVDVTALSNGTNLMSSPSDPINFTTDVYVPGVGSVCVSVHEPAAMAVAWTLAFSGGFPVLYFEIEYRKIGATHWRTAAGKFQETAAENTLRLRRSPMATGGRYSREMNVTVEPSGGQELLYVVPGYQRNFITRRLEAEEQYVFRVRAGNELGEGEYTESEAVLSHSLGVPRQPTRPQVTGWSHDHAIVSTIVHKVGSTQNFSITMILLVNVTTEVSRHVVLVEGYEGGDGIELVFPNVSYEHEWRFQVFASNYLGNSEYSLMSAAAHEGLVDSAGPYDQASIVLITVFAVMNVLIVVSVTAFCVVMGRDTCQQRENMARRVEMAQAYAEVPFSPRSFPSTSNMDTRCSPEGRSNTHGTPCEPMYERISRRFISPAKHTLPTCESSVSAV